MAPQTAPGDGSTGRDCLTGTVEVDETYVGGPEEGKRGREVETKAIVVVAAEKSGRGVGRIRLRRVKDVSGDSLRPFVQGSVVPGSVVHTDGWNGYSGLAAAGYKHQVTVIKSGAEPAHEVMPRIHMVASLLKRWLIGTHQGGIQHQHLDYYLDEFTFRFNRRRSQARGLLFHRLAQQAVAVPPAPYHTIVGPRPDVLAIIGDMVRNGLRAELASANLLTGALAVALEIEAGAPAAELQQGQARVPEIPTSRSSYSSATDQLEQVMTRVAALPLEQVVDGLDGLIGAARKIVDDPALLQLLRNLARTSAALAPAAQQLEPALQALTSTLEQARASLAEAQRLAEELAGAARGTPSNARRGCRRCRLVAGAGGPARAPSRSAPSRPERLKSQMSGLVRLHHPTAMRTVDWLYGFIIRWREVQNLEQRDQSASPPDCLEGERTQDDAKHGPKREPDYHRNRQIPAASRVLARRAPKYRAHGAADAALIAAHGRRRHVCPPLSFNCRAASGPVGAEPLFVYIWLQSV